MPRILQYILRFNETFAHGKLYIWFVVNFISYPEQIQGFPASSLPTIRNQNQTHDY